MTDAKKQTVKVMKWFDRAIAHVEEARNAAAKGDAQKANGLRRKANKAMKKALGSMSEEATPRRVKKEIDPL